MRQLEREHNIDTIFVLALFFVFAVTALMSVGIGIQVYKKTAAGMEKNFVHRTGVAYVTEKIRQNPGPVSAETDKLVLSYTKNTATYHTIIYEYNGSLMELSVAEGTAYKPGDGQEITKADAFTAELAAPNLIRITVTDADGSPQTQLVSVSEGLT